MTARSLPPSLPLSTARRHFPPDPVLVNASCLDDESREAPSFAVAVNLCLQINTCGECISKRYRWLYLFHFPSATKTSNVWVNIQNPDFATCNSPAACDLKFRNFDGTPVSTLYFSAIAVNPINDHHLCLNIEHSTNAGKLSHTNCQNKKKVLCEAVCGENLGIWLQQPTSSCFYKLAKPSVLSKKN